MMRQWSKTKVIVIVLLCTLIGNLVILNLFPKGISYLSNTFGYELDSDDLTTNYLVGIAVRMIGSLLCLILMIKTGIWKRFSFRIHRKDLLISWIFFIYIAVNIETGSLTKDQLLAAFLMVISCILVGFFEEFLFRGIILSFLLTKWGSTQRQVYGSVVISSLLFGIFHLTNLLKQVPPITVFVQVFYATIIGIAFAALFLRSNYNLLWCVILHAIYDIASEFGDVLASGSKKAAVVVQTKIDIGPYLMEQLLFVPLLLYAIYLLRKVKRVESMLL